MAKNLSAGLSRSLSVDRESSPCNTEVRSQLDEGERGQYDLVQKGLMDELGHNGRVGWPPGVIGGSDGGPFLGCAGGWWVCKVIRLLELGDWRHGKADVLLYCIVTNQCSPGKSFENRLSSLTWEPVLARKSSNSVSGLEEIDIFPEAFPRLRFLLRSQQGSSPAHRKM